MVFWGAAPHPISPQTNTVTTDSNIARQTHSTTCTHALSWKGRLLRLLLVGVRGRTSPFGSKATLLAEYQSASLLANLPLISSVCLISTPVARNCSLVRH